MQQRINNYLVRLWNHIVDKRFLYYLIAAILLFRTSWKIALIETYKYRLDSLQYENYKTLIRHFFEFRLKIPDRFYPILEIYIEALFTKNVFFGFFNFSLIIFTIIFFIFLFLIKKYINFSYEYKKFFFFIFIYACFLFTVYAFIFSDGESYGLSSFTRYLLPITVGLYFYLICFFSEKKIFNTKYFFLFLLLLFPFLNHFFNPNVYEKKGFISNIYNFTKPIIKKKFWLNNIKYDNQDITNEIIISFINKHKEKINELCFIEGREGASYGYNLRANYIFSPMKFRRIITYKGMSKQELERHVLNNLGNCNKILVVEPDKNLNMNYFHLFSPKIIDNSIYDINNKNNMLLFTFEDCIDCELKIK